MEVPYPETPVSTPGPEDEPWLQPMSKRLRRHRGAWTMPMNLTPMIDVVILLLAFFIMVSRFTRPEGTLAAELPAPRQGAAAGDQVPREPIRVVVRQEVGEAGGCFATIERLHPEPIPIAALAAALTRICQTTPGYDLETPVLLQAGDDVIWDHVVNAYNAATLAQFKHILFAQPGPAVSERKP